MKVVQVTPGRFHHFNLARQLYRRGALARIYTGYPLWKLREHEEVDSRLPLDYVHTFPWLEVPYMALSKYGARSNIANALRRTTAYHVTALLDQHAASTLPEADVLVAQARCGLKSGHRMRARGGKYVCDSGSTHIRYQTTTLSEEYARWGLRHEAVPASIVFREEEEYALADAITVPSQFALETFVSEGVPRQKLLKIPYGVELEKFSKVADPSRNSFDVLFVGGLNLRKGVPYLLEAFSNLQHPRKRLRLVGTMSGDMEEFFKRQPPDENVEIVGHVPQAQLRDIMSRSHVMVLPSIEEGLALVQAQALACGCPVLATFNTGASDLFTDGQEGFIVPPRDSKLLANRLQQLADDSKLRERMSDRAIEVVKTNRGWDAYGERIVSAISSIRSRRSA